MNEGAQGYQRAHNEKRTHNRQIEDDKCVAVNEGSPIHVVGNGGTLRLWMNLKWVAGKGAFDFLLSLQISEVQDIA